LRTFKLTWFELFSPQDQVDDITSLAIPERTGITMCPELAKPLDLSRAERQRKKQSDRIASPALVPNEVRARAKRLMRFSAAPNPGSAYHP